MNFQQTRSLEKVYVLNVNFNKTYLLTVLLVLNEGLAVYRIYSGHPFSLASMLLIKGFRMQ